MDISSESSLFVVKYLAGFCTAGFASLGIIGKFRDKDGKITKLGYSAIFGVVVSCLFGIVTLSLEQKINYEKTREDINRLSKNIERQSYLLKEIARLSYEIDSFDFKIEYEANANLKYLKPTSILIESYIGDSNYTKKNFDKIGLKHFRRSVYISKDSKILEEKNILNSSKVYPTFTLSLAREPVDVSKIPDYNVFPEKGFEEKYLDRTFFLPSEIVKRKPQSVSFGVGDSIASYILEKKYFKFSFRFNKATTLYNSGNIFSVLDLPGSMLILFTPFSPDDSNYKVTDIHINLNRGESLDWSLNKQIMKHELNSIAINNKLVYFYVFSKKDFDVVNGAVFEFDKNTK